MSNPKVHNLKKAKYFHVRINENIYVDDTQDSTCIPKGGWHDFHLRSREWLEDIFERSPNILDVAYQLECGSTGIRHWQLTIGLNLPWNKFQLKTVLQVQKGETYFIEACRNVQASAQYCRKTDTRIEGPFSYKKKGILDAMGCIDIEK